MNLQQIKYAIEVYKCGSISKAAEKLYMNQPNLSRIIMNLENEYGIYCSCAHQEELFLHRKGKTS
jgi:DNA-binding transcriptional LysR family regulator